MTSQIGHGDVKIGKFFAEECLKNVILKLEKQDRAWGCPKLNKYFCSTWRNDVPSSLLKAAWLSTFLNKSCCVVQAVTVTNEAILTHSFGIQNFIFNSLWTEIQIQSCAESSAVNPELCLTSSQCNWERLWKLLTSLTNCEHLFCWANLVLPLEHYTAEGCQLLISLPFFVRELLECVQMCYRPWTQEWVNPW